MSLPSPDTDDTKSSPQPEAKPSCDVTASNFMQEVMDPSQTQLVIIEFWAPWCAPCKQLAPSLETIVSETGGAAKLTKIDIDKNPQIAEQLHVQSVPTVFAFFDRQLIDGFMGVLPESQIREWIDGLITKTGAKATNEQREKLEEALAHANNCLETDAASTALSIFSAILEKHPNNLEAFIGLLHSLISLGETQKAADILSKAPADIIKNKKLIPIQASIDLALEAAKAQETPTEPLLARLSANENDHQARFDLALAYYAQNDIESAINALLDIIKRDRKWQNEAARTQLVKIFEALGHMHPQTIEARKKLSTILFS
ncbi:MAG: tetratricopeptide repeat protein [Alphaproteobacteria bacterium]|nr:tetratricopeptide repeat protein [Alphaproteobacteria bacterium]